MIKHFILEGKKPKEVDMMTWAMWLGDISNRRVAEYDHKGVRISTVFVGLPMFSIDDDKLLLFETMVFGGEHDGKLRRYETWEEAEAGHNLLVAACTVVLSVN